MGYSKDIPCNQSINQTGNKIKTIMTVKLFGSALLLLLSLHIGNASPVNQRLSDAKLPPDEVNEAELDAYKDAALEFVKVFNDDLAKIAKEEEVVEVIKVDPKKGSKHSDPHIIAIEDKNAGQDNDADNDLLLAALAAEDKESEDDGEVIEVIKAEDYETEDSSSDDDEEVIEVV